MKVTPLQSVAPTNLQVRLRIEPSAENRILAVVADSDEFYRSSEISLEGEQAPRTIVVEFRDLPGGDSEVRSVLIDNASRSRGWVRQHARVLPVGRD